MKIEKDYLDDWQKIVIGLNGESIDPTFDSERLDLNINTFSRHIEIYKKRNISDKKSIKLKTLYDALNKNWELIKQEYHRKNKDSYKTSLDFPLVEISEESFVLTGTWDFAFDWNSICLGSWVHSSGYRFIAVEFLGDLENILVSWRFDNNFIWHPCNIFNNHLIVRVPLSRIDSKISFKFTSPKNLKIINEASINKNNNHLKTKCYRVRVRNTKYRNEKSIELDNLVKELDNLIGKAVFNT